MGVVRKREVSRAVPGFWPSGLVGGTIPCDREHRDKRIFGGSEMMSTVVDMLSSTGSWT